MSLIEMTTIWSG